METRKMTIQFPVTTTGHGQGSGLAFLLPSVIGGPSLAFQSKGAPN